MIDESHIQAIARFLIGFGTEQDDKWRDYNLDFAGDIDYDNAGNPKAFRPVGESGYSLGSLQWDFGQGPELSVPFVDAFEDWISQNPTGRPLKNDSEFVGRALSLTGSKLRDHPRLGLHEQDVLALSEYVRTDTGSDWVNKNIDMNLIGSDQQPNIEVNGQKFGQTLLHVARTVEKTAAFKAFVNQHRNDLADLIFAIGMKTYNQSPRNFNRKLLPFLGARRTPNEVSTWYEQFSGGLLSGVRAATKLSLFWATWLQDNQGGLADKLVKTMHDQCLDNPTTASRAGGDYMLAKQVFENTDRFEKFTKAVHNDTDFVDPTLFVRRTGAIAIHPVTKHPRHGVLAWKHRRYVWNGAGDAFRSTNGVWNALPIAEINIRTL